MSRRPNVLWLKADQLRADMIACNGDPNVKTPNIDALAADGVNFTRAVSGYPLCCPARGSMLTSIYPNRCTLGHEYRMPPEQKTIANVMNDNGYHTAYIGKWHLDGWHEKDSRAAWHVVPRERRGGFKYWLGYENNNSQYDCYVHGGGEGYGEMPITKLDGYETDCLTDLLLQHLDTIADDQPFFAVMSVQPPHNPYVAPERNQHYPAETLKLRPNMPPEIAPYTEFVEKMRKNLSNAYAMIENFDENVGRVVQYLKDRNLYDNTIIMVFSDHGDMHGSHSWQRKTNPMEESIRVPFVIGGKKLTHLTEMHGIRLPHLLNSVDIAPTTLGLCCIPCPREWEGVDYSDVCKRKKKGDFSYPTSAYLQNVIPEHHPHSVELPWRGVVTMDGWKYVCLEGMPWMLYNLNEDPYELRNLAFHGLYHIKRAELSRQLKDWIERTGDTFRLPEIDQRNDLVENARDVFGYPEYPLD